MYCRKCGQLIPDDSDFCQNCGEPIINIKKAEVSIPNENIEQAPENNSAEETNQSTAQPILISKPKKIGIVLLTSIVIAVIVVIAIINSCKCKYDGCSNKKSSGGQYCYQHTCIVSGCYSQKAYSGDYCYYHKCSYSGCTNRSSDDSIYCSKHTCSVDGCYEKVEDGYSKCKTHLVEITTLLNDLRPSFSLGNYGKVTFRFEAQNNTGKTIKYIKFDVRFINSVADIIKTESVTITGPYLNGSSISYKDASLCYCSDAYKLLIYDIEIIYTDGTSETAPFNTWMTAAGELSGSYTMGKITKH